MLVRCGGIDSRRRGDALEEAAEGEGGEGNKNGREQEWLLKEILIWSDETDRKGYAGDEIDERNACQEGGDEHWDGATVAGKCRGYPSCERDQANRGRERIPNHPPRAHGGQWKEEHGA